MDQSQEFGSSSTSPGRRASTASCSTALGNFLGAQSCSSLQILTDALENPLGLVLPPDPEEVNGDPTEDDGKANPTLLGRHPEGNGDEEQAGQDEEDGQADVHLSREQGTGQEMCQGSRGGSPGVYPAWGGME